MSFYIGDRVKIAGGKISGVIVDKLYSEAADRFTYMVEHDGGTGQVTSLFEDGIRKYEEVSYRVAVDCFEGVVTVIVYECCGEKEVEVARGHGHDIHGGRDGFVQALSYATKKAWGKLNNRGGNLARWGDEYEDDSM